MVAPVVPKPPRATGPHRLFTPTVRAAETLPELHQALRQAGAPSPKKTKVSARGPLDRFAPEDLPDAVSVGTTPQGREYVALRVADEVGSVGVLTLEPRSAPKGSENPKPEWVVSTSAALSEISLSRGDHPPASAAALSLVTGLLKGETVSVGDKGGTLRLTRQTHNAVPR